MTPAGVTATASFLMAAGLVVWAPYLRCRRGRVSEEDRAWRLILSGVVLISVAALIAQIADIPGLLGSRPSDGGGRLLFSIGCVVACIPIYRGLVHWIRVRTGSSDPGEMLNGFGSFFVTMAIGNLLLSTTYSLREWPGWQFQASIGASAASVIVFGTSVSVAAIGGWMRDRRIWLVVVAISVICAGQLWELLTSGEVGSSSRICWLLPAAVITACAQIAPGSAHEQVLNHRATVVGAVMVLVAGVVVLTANGALVHDRRPMSAVLAAIGVLVVSLRLLRLVQELAQLTQTRRLAMTDDLTDLPNRRALLLAIDEALVAAGSPSLMIIGLHRFKAINDRYGHAAGDLLLRHVARGFLAHIPDGALLARLGGDEFAVLLKNTSTDDALEIAHTLARAAARPLKDVTGQVLHVKARIGVAGITGSAVGGGELLRRADTALEQTKNSETGICEYDSAVDTAKHERLALIEDLQATLEAPPGEQQIVVYFQPQLSTCNGTVVGAEALVRWAHPRLGLLSPDRFIDLAEQNGLMPQLTALVMREATTQARVWRAAGHHLRVSVNLSATYLNDPDLLPLIEDVLRLGLAAEDLVLEVTETSVMSDPELSLAAMKRLAERGVGVSIDDYGTGYSSLSYLHDLPATELKIDQSFTARVLSDPRTAAIVSGTAELAHRLGIRLIAEGVEDEATLAAMTRLGCDETQGYLHSRPLPGTTFLQWLQRQSSAASGASSAATSQAFP